MNAKELYDIAAFDEGPTTLGRMLAVLASYAVDGELAALMNREYVSDEIHKKLEALGFEIRSISCEYVEISWDQE